MLGLGARTAMIAGTMTRNGPITRANARVRALAFGVAGISVSPLGSKTRNRFGGSQDYIGALDIEHVGLPTTPAVGSSSTVMIMSVAI
jgi:hypothetical protein